MYYVCSQGKVIKELTFSLKAAGSFWVLVLLVVARGRGPSLCSATTFALRCSSPLLDVDRLARLAAIPPPCPRHRRRPPAIPTMSGGTRPEAAPPSSTATTTTTTSTAADTTTSPSSSSPPHDAADNVPDAGLRSLNHCTSAVAYWRLALKGRPAPCAHLADPVRLL
jgi:hypothetical protein